MRLRQSFEAGLRQQAEHHGAERRLLDERLESSSRELTRSESRNELLDDQLHSAKTDLNERTRELADRQAAHAAIEARLDESQKGFAEKEALFRT